MTNFNIEGSKIDQLNNSGNNYKQTSREGNNALAGEGNVAQTEGTENKVVVNKPKEDLFSIIWKRLKMLWGGGVN